MTDKMQRFCDLYLSNGRNATKAYKEAGYKFKTDHTAESAAHRMLRNVEVIEYLNNHAETIKAKAEHEQRLLTAEELCMELCKIITDPANEKTGDRLHAMELYGKTLNLFNTANVNVNTAPIVIIDDLDE